MPILRTFNFKLIVVTFSLLISSCAFAQNSKITPNSDNKKNTQKNTKIEIDNLLKEQILLTNQASFTKERNLAGASAFLINYKENNFALTAKHLLGEAGGIKPEISANDLSKSIESWEMMPRVVANTGKETIKVTADGVDQSAVSADILLLKVTSKDFQIKSLIPKFELPEIDETLFLIGCPYSESQCKQNSYRCRFDGILETDLSLVCEMENKEVNLAGFSGAPLINSNGEVLGVLVSGGGENGKSYSIATHIKEIQKIKIN